MEISISTQLRSLGIALALGLCLGLVYDLLRPVRRCCGKTAVAVTDVAFALISGAALFSFAMGASCGSLGIWELTAAFIGFIAYLYTLSDLLYPLISRAEGHIMSQWGRFS